MSHLHRTDRVISRIYAEEMRPTGVGRSQFTILNVLDRSPAISVSGLANRLAMERTTLTRNLKPLEREALVARRVDPGDARQAQLVLTRAGRHKLDLAQSYWRRAQRRVIEAFGEDRWRELEAELSALREAGR